MSDFVTYGELLIDFTPAGNQEGRKLFMQNAGGAPANVAAAIAGFGVSSSFVGMVGNDVFGHFLKSVLDQKGVNTSELALSDIYNTTLAFVHLFENGDRDFSFYRKPGADIMYETTMLNKTHIRQARVFHIGSVSMTDEPSRSTSFSALKTAKEAGVVVSYDPNYRAPLWSDADTAREVMREGLHYADILKISDNESEFLFGSKSYEEAARILIKNGVRLVFITLGSEGAIYAHASGVGRAAGFPAKAVDTTGAGDCFTAGVLSQFLHSGKTLEALTLEDIHRFACYANAAASICVEGRGGIPSMPSVREVENRLNMSGGV
jgi:fructokinase